MSYSPGSPGAPRGWTANAVAAVGALAFTLVIFAFSQLAYSATPSATATSSDGWTQLDAAPRGDAWVVTGLAGPYRAVAFGGQSGVPGNDTLVYDGVSWRRLELTTGTRPAVRRTPSLVPGDAGRVLLYGGQSTDPDAEVLNLGDLWELQIGADGRGSWREVTPAGGPRPVARPSLALGKKVGLDGADERLPFYMLYGAGQGGDEVWLLNWDRASYAYSWARSTPYSSDPVAAAPDAQLATVRMCLEAGCFYQPALVNTATEGPYAPYQLLWTYRANVDDPQYDEWFQHYMGTNVPTNIARPVLTGTPTGEYVLLLDAGDAPDAPLEAWLLRDPSDGGISWQRVSTPSGLTTVASPIVFYDQAAARFILVNGPGGTQWALGDLQATTPTWALEPAGAPGEQPAVSSLAYAEPVNGPAGAYAYAEGALWRHDGSYWHRVGAPASAPLAAARLVYAPDSRLLYLVGMLADAAQPAAIWSFDGQAWSAIPTAGGPTSAYADGFHAAYDHARGQIVLFGGARADGQIQPGAWALRPGQGWASIDLGVQGRRAGGAFVWDNTRDRGVLFGGLDAAGLATGTWLLTYDAAAGYSWSAADGTSPPLRTGAAAAFDSARGRVVLFGGVSADRAAAVEQNTVWEFDTAWSFRNLTAPRARYGHAMAFVPGAEPYVLLAGGALPGGQPASETWLYRSSIISTPPTTVPTFEPTIDPTAPPVPTLTPLPDQGFRDNGVVRIWADSFFTEPDGLTTRAVGNVIVGAQLEGDAGKYFTVSDSASWKDGGALELRGRVSYLQGDQGLAAGTFSVAQDTGVMAWPQDAEPLYRKLGSSELAITPTLSVNVVKTTVRAVTVLALELPEEQTLGLNLDFTIEPDGSLTSSAALPISLKLAGGTLTANVTIDRLGLTASTAELKLPDLETSITLKNLKIHGRGDNKLSFDGSTVFPIPDLVVNSNFGLKDITANLGLVRENNQFTKYRIRLSVGTVTLPKLPLKSGAAVEGASFEIATGKLRGQINKLKLVLAGEDLVLEDLKYNGGVGAAAAQGLAAAAANEPLAFLYSTRAAFPMPKAWALPGFEAPKVLVEDVRIYDHEPYITIGATGTRLDIADAYYLAGNPDSTVKVRFDQLKGDLVYILRDQKLELTLEGQLTIAAGKDNSTSTSVRLRFWDEGVTGRVNQASLTVAGVLVSAETLDYSNDTFTAATASVAMPGSIGGGAVSVTNLRITKDRVYIDGGGGEFTLSDRDIGSVLRLSGTKGKLELDGQGNFRFALNGTIAIRNIEAIGTGNGITTSATLTIRNGRVSGSVSGFGFTMAGLGFEVLEPKFLDNRITARTVGITLPEKLGGGSTALYNLEIGGEKGFSLGGGRFTIPDFTIGTVGVQNVQAEFFRTQQGSYAISGRATFNFEAFSVDGSFKLEYITEPPDVQLKQVRLAFAGSILRGTAIPIADSGLYITNVSGEFDLSSGVLELRFGLRVASAATIDLPIAGETSLVSAIGEVYIKASPFELRTSAATQLVGLTVNQVDVRITSSSFTLRATTEWQVARSALTIAFGEDSDGDFTFYGQAYTEIGLKRGSVGCVLFACLPPVDFTIERRGYDFGKFRHEGRKVYGVRAFVTAFGFDFFAFARVAPTMGVDAGMNLDEYQPVLPAFTSAMATTQAVGTYDISVDAPATQLVVLEAVSEENRAAPQEATVSGPTGVAFTSRLTYQSENGDTRIYVVSFDAPEQAVGLWQITPQQGNQLKVWGADPPARAARFEASVEGGPTLAPAAQQPTPRYTLAGGESINLAWTATDDEPDLELQVYAENSEGARFPIAAQRGEASLSGTQRWPLALPSGTYTLTLAADDGRNIIAYARMEPIVVHDTTGPAAPTGLSAEARPDGSVRLSWSGPAPAADHQGYQVRIGAGGPITHRGDEPSLEVYGLAAGKPYTLAVAAYDKSGNVGPEASVAVTMPSFQVSATAPRRGEHLETVAEVSVSLAEPAATVALSVVDGSGQPAAGAAEHVLTESEPDVFEVTGARFVPAGGALPAGAYTAVALVTDGSGATHELRWPFTVVAPPPAPVAPDTVITAAPTGEVAETSASVAFTSSGGSTPVRYECSLDGAPFTACASPLELTGLSSGEHVVQVRAVGSDGLADETPAVARWTVRAPAPVAPDTLITAAPTGEVAETSASVAFTSSGGSTPVRYECSLDGAPFTACASPLELTGLSSGEHVVQVRAVGSDGLADETPAVARWTVRAQGPDPALCYASGAQTWQDFKQGKMKNGKPVHSERSKPALALGLPQKTDTINFVALGFGGSLTLRFANPIINDGTVAPDIRVWETSFNDAGRGWSKYPEAVRVFASADGVTWTEIGRTTDKDQAYDLKIARAQFIRVVDVSDPKKFGSTDDGFDLDAIEVLSGCQRP